MKLFRWHSEGLKNYRRGDILVIGADVEAARSAARRHFEVAACSRWKWLYDIYPDYILDDDDREERDKKIALLEADIMREPEISEAFFIEGGE